MDLKSILNAVSSFFVLTDTLKARKEIEDLKISRTSKRVINNGLFLNSWANVLSFSFSFDLFLKFITPAIVTFLYYFIQEITKTSRIN